MAVISTWTAVRDLLTADLTLAADQVIAKAKAMGVKAPDDAIRTTVHTLRKRLKKKAAAPPAAAKPARAAKSAPPPKPTPAAKPPVTVKPAATPKPASAPKAAPVPKPVAAAAKRTAAPSASSAVRAILSTDLDLPADAVIARAKAKGVTAPDASIRNAVHNIRSELKKATAKLAPEVKAAPATIAEAPPPGGEVAGVLANVALVHAAVAACGGVEHARQVAEAVRACGGAEAFGTYLDLVAGIRGPGTGS